MYEYYKQSNYSTLYRYNVYFEFLPDKSNKWKLSRMFTPSNKVESILKGELIPISDEEAEVMILKVNLELL